MKGTNYLVDFTPQERLTALALNLLFGAGSFFVERDKFGGILTASFEGVGVFIIILGNSVGSEAKTPQEQADASASMLSAMGIGLYVIGAIYGVYRAQKYHKPGSQIAAGPLTGLGIELVPTAYDNIGLKVSYKWKF